MSDAHPVRGGRRTALADTQLRHNLAHATHSIRDKRAAAVAELPDWEQLRDAGRELKDRVLRHLDDYLVELEAAVTRNGGTVHWARDAGECNRIIAELVLGRGTREVVKVKSLTTEEIGLNEALAQRGIHALETDLAQLIIQLAGEPPSHMLVPAIHKNRTEIRDLFRAQLPDAPADLSDDARAAGRASPARICAGCSWRRGSGSAAPTSRSPRPARSPSSSPRATGGCARRCRETLITVMGIEKVVPASGATSRCSCSCCRARRPPSG